MIWYDMFLLWFEMIHTHTHIYIYIYIMASASAAGPSAFVMQDLTTFLKMSNESFKFC